MSQPLVLSLFPGIGLFDMAFEEEEEGVPTWAYAWAAGLFDGEGCISIATFRQGQYRDYYYRVDLIVANTNRGLLEALLALFGGRIERSHRTSNQRPAWQWKMTGTARAAVVLRLIRPWLIVKQEQAGLALHAAELLVRTGYRRKPENIASLAAMKQEMHRLNKRGVA